MTLLAICLGIPANLLSLGIFVRFRHRLHHSIYDYMKILSIVDTVNLAVTLPFCLVELIAGPPQENVVIINNSGLLVRMTYHLYASVSALQTVSAWLTACVSLDRVIKVSMPRLSEKVCRKRVAYIVSFGVIIMSFLYTLPRYFSIVLLEQEIVDMNCYVVYIEIVPESEDLELMTFITHMVIQFGIPGLIIFGCAWKIRQTVRSANSIRESMTTQRRTKTKSQAIYLPWIIAGIFTVLQGPAFAQRIIQMVTNQEDNEVFAVLIPISNFLLFSYSAVHLFLFYFSGSLFRRMFLFTYWNGKLQDNSTGSFRGSTFSRNMSVRYRNSDATKNRVANSHSSSSMKENRFESGSSTSTKGSRHDSILVYPLNSGRSSIAALSLTSNRLSSVVSSDSRATALLDFTQRYAIYPEQDVIVEADSSSATKTFLTPRDLAPNVLQTNTFDDAELISSEYILFRLQCMETVI